MPTSRSRRGRVSGRRKMRRLTRTIKGREIFRLRLRTMLMVCGAALFVLGSTLTSETPPPARSVSSSDRTSDFPPPHWLRTSGASFGSHYVGSRVCAGCHSGIAKTQSNTPMGKASVGVLESRFLLQHPTLTYNDGTRVLRIERRGNQEVYSVNDGTHTISAPILWAFGLGDAGQTYVFERDGIYYESRISYYKAIDGLDLTIGHLPEPPATLSDALGRRLSKEEVAKCFPCHTSEDVVNNQVETSHVQTGVTCENCHGPGSQHLEAIQDPQSDRLHIFNPRTLSAGDLNDFCGTCHRSTRDVLAANIRGIRNVRFQPYRLENSRCYDPSDKRTSCLACHDPHRNLVVDPGSYDVKCLACHANRSEKPTTASKAAACPTAIKNCTSCHMPKLDLPGAHYKFTDHYIRVYRPGDAYPD
jgi:hypothetical protein